MLLKREKMDIETMEKCTYCEQVLDEDQFMYCSSECAHDDYVAEISSYYHCFTECLQRTLSREFGTKKGYIN